MVEKTVLRHGANCFCGVCDVREFVYEPGELLPPEESKAREKLRECIVSVFEDMQAARASAGLGAPDPIAMRQGKRINAVGAAARHTGNKALMAGYKSGMALWAPQPVKVAAKAKRADA